AVGKLYGFDDERLVHALGIAGSSSAGLLEFAWSGGDTKRLHLGRASQLGLESALLAREGVRGPATVLEGRSGYFNAFSTPPQIERLVAGLGSAWAIEPPSHKSYATHVTQQAVVQAIQQLKREQPNDPRASTRVAARGAARIMKNATPRASRTTCSADSTASPSPSRSRSRVTCPIRSRTTTRRSPTRSCASWRVGSSSRRSRRQHTRCL